MKLSKLLTSLSLLALTACSTVEGWVETEKPQAPKPYQWAAYYNYALEGEDFAGYDLVVLDSAWFPPVAPIKEQGITVLGYLSLGEVHEDTPLYALAKEQGILLDDNPTWKSHIVDIRSPWWHKYILEFAIPALQKDGFEGAMLDTIESPLLMLELGPEDKHTMHKAAVSLIQGAKHRFPNFKLMLNRGFELLPEVAGYIDYILAESILAVPDEQKPGNYRELKASYYQSIVAMLHKIQKIHPRLPVYTLDYWQLNDRRGIQKLYKTQRDQGFRPYISTPDLRSLHREKQ